MRVVEGSRSVGWGSLGGGMDLRLSDVGDHGVRVVHLCVSGEGRCQEERKNSLQREKEEQGNSPPLSRARSSGHFGGRFRRLNSANLLPALSDLRSIRHTRIVRLPPPSHQLTLAASQRRLTRNDFDLAATRLLAAHRHQQLEDTSLEHASLEQRRYPLATGWQWHVVSGSRVWMSRQSRTLRRPPLISFFHPQWTSGIGHLRQRDFGVKLLRPRKGPFAAEQDDPLPPTDGSPDDDSSALDPNALAESDAAEICNVRLSICYSPSYGVPVLWLEAHKRGPPVSPSRLSAFPVGH